ncbi:geranylgeranylglyceryl/heptaprenylglyceryl phosphate synthase [Stygiolobus caldivivus]|nr:geranylgeranylglyceryl/heptaprenylglyceryl phosphate synthase [Stygiolobus caldivivus]
MRMKGKVKNYIRELVDEGKVIHLSLFDPDKVDESQVYTIGKKLVEAGTDGFLIGGTLGVSQEKLDRIISTLEEFGLPTIIFPSNVNLISSKADAILFMSLLNSDDLYYVVGAQLVAAPIIKKLGLEVLPTAYLIIGHGGTAAHVGKARVIPYDNVELILAYSLMARYMGMEYIYLEAGSGAPKTVDPIAVKVVKNNVNGAIVIVGGGIRDEESGKLLANAGADIIVTGNIIEQDSEKALKIIKGIKSMRRS